MNRTPSLIRNPPRNFVEHLQQLAAERPEATALIVVKEQQAVPVDTLISYAQLDRRVKALAGRLQRRFALGERALLLLDNDDHYVVAFFACLYAGLIAVPVFPPESVRPQHLARLLGIAEDAQARCLLTSSAMLDRLGAALEDFKGCEAVAADLFDESDLWQPRHPADEDIAFLQYTSGSTATPKGVMVSHANLIANERAIEEGLSVGSDDVFVSWLPLYHDMGLIGGLLQPLHRGIPAVLMTPQFFLERPIRWLEAISRHRGSISGGPDFAYRLCIERVKAEQLTQLDLSSWRLAFSGSEPVRQETLQDFIDGFSPAGFAAEAVYPCYGLAEATLFLCGGQRGTGMVTRAFSPESLGRGLVEEHSNGSILVSCGHAPSEHELKILDPQSLKALAEGTVGEIWACGPSLAQGYWQRPEETAQSFVEHEGQRWLRTGDLGFMYEGRLYIAGRIKDLIILRGQNIYPQDIERAIEAEVEAVRKGRVAAFAVPLASGGEGVGVAVEVPRGLQKLIPLEVLVEALSQSVSLICREPLSVALLLNPSALPKTSSGKLQRGACRRAWERGELDAYAIYEQGRFVLGTTARTTASLAEPRPFDELETAVAALWQRVLNGDTPPQPETHFFAAGGNSLAAVQLAARIAEHWAMDFPVRFVFEQPRFDALVQEVRQRLAQDPQIKQVVIPRLSPEQRAQPLALSHAQERQWFLWQLDPKSSAYHICLSLRLSGLLNLDALRAAVEGLVAQHESLRTLFCTTDAGRPAQWIQPSLALDIAVIDLRTGPEALAQVQCLQTEPFDLSSGPLLRLAVIRSADEVQRLIIVMHHIISDAASMQVLLDELAARYIAHLQGEAIHSKAPSIQYVDYALWQREWLAAGEAARQRAWWRNQLGTEHPLLQLPYDQPPKARANYRAAHYSFELSKELLANLRHGAEARGATLFMLLLAGFQGLLYRYSGQEDIRVGVPVANRQRLETLGLIGLFVNTLVMRNPLHSHLRLDAVLAQTREAALEAQAHQDLPFEQLVEALQPERSLSHNPLFQVMFNHLQEDYRAVQQLPGLTLEVEEPDEPTAQFELTLNTRETPDGQLRARFSYAAELFDASSIERLAGHYSALLHALVEQPQQTLAEVVLLSDTERHQLSQWGENPQHYPNPEPVHRLFEHQAHQQPKAIALILGDERLSYAELNRRANRLAHRLRTLGVAPESRVGIFLERSIDMIVGLLGILKAGGAYVPLDPDYPDERLAYMVEDSGLELLLTQSSLKERIATELPIWALDELRLEAESEHNPAFELHGDNLAYVIYTSGSTGQPKGVLVSHGPFSMHCQETAVLYEMGSSARELHFLSFSFDGAHERLFTILGCGASLLLRDTRLWTAEQTLAALQDQAVTNVGFPPVYLQELARVAREQDRYPPVRLYSFGGEAMPQEGFKAISHHLKPDVLINGYGPTEAVVTPVLWKTAAMAQFEAKYTPIGRPVGDRKTMVLDSALNLVPAGVAGELYLGGVGLARGYLNRPRLTAERFIADPLGTGERLYRTGDWVRWSKEGQLEYLGRIDHQVKIRGFRIELGEIEAQLLAQPEVREAVVVAQDSPSGARLVGYVVGPHVDGAALRERLSQGLPDYMLPTVLMVLEALPLTANGKIDRKALPAAELLNHQAYEAPQGEIEAQLAEIWAEVLGVEQVGRWDNFFELGGHSLLAIRVTALLTQRHGHELAVRHFFNAPTIQTLATHLSVMGLSNRDSKEQRLAKMDSLLSEFEV